MQAMFVKSSPQTSHTVDGNNVTDSMVRLLPATLISSCFFFLFLLLLFLFVVDELSGVVYDGGILEFDEVFLVFFFHKNTEDNIKQHHQRIK